MSVTDNTENSEISSEQQNCSTLLTCWNMAKASKGGYVIEDSILYHHEKVEGQSVCQLCLPKCRRSAVMHLAHDSIFGGHLGHRKAQERIRLSFYWPNMRQEI